MKKLWILLFWFLTILGLEFLLKFCIYGNVFNSNIWYLIVFSFLNAFGIYFITTIFNKKLSKVMSFVFLILVILIFLIQLVYYKIFSAFFTLDAVTMANVFYHLKKIYFNYFYRQPVFCFV